MSEVVVRMTGDMNVTIVMAALMLRMARVVEDYALQKRSGNIWRCPASARVLQGSRAILLQSSWQASADETVVVGDVSTELDLCSGREIASSHCDQQSK